jgi:hypothetical protein
MGNTAKKSTTTQIMPSKKTPEADPTVQNTPTSEQPAAESSDMRAHEGTNAEKATDAAVQEPELDFEGNVAVDDSLPSSEAVKQCEDMLVLDSKGASHSFKSLYSGDGVAPRQLIIFVRHFYCGVSIPFLSF